MKASWKKDRVPGFAPPRIRAAKPLPQWEEEEDVLVEDDIGEDLPAQIIVYNDDFNTFEWVIQCFVEVLGHSPSSPNSWP